MPMTKYREVCSKVLHTYTERDQTIVEHQVIYYNIEDAEFLLQIVKKNLEADDILRETNIHISELESISCMRVYQEDNADVYSKKYGKGNE